MDTTKPQPKTHGGAGRGQGRKPKFGDETLRSRSVRLSDAQAQALIQLGGTLSNGIHLLIDRHLGQTLQMP